jgi:Uma2 family endonuclease
MNLSTASLPPRDLRPDLEGLAADEFLTPGTFGDPVTVARPSRIHAGFLAPPRWRGNFTVEWRRYDLSMAPIVSALLRPAGVHRFSVEDVYAMTAAGLFDENARIELVQGVLVDMVPIGAEHDGALAWLNEHFAGVRDRAWEVRIQSVLLVEGGYLLPDLSIVEPLPRSRQPTSALLVVELAQTSQARDREKARDYAAADVPDYWIVDLQAREVTVHRRPLAGIYDDVTIYADGEVVRPLLEDAPAVVVSELLG